MATETRSDARHTATHRTYRKIEFPKDAQGQPLKASQIYGEYTFDFRVAEGIPSNIRKELIEISRTGKRLTKEYAEIVSRAALQWAVSKGATHFCHWFQPLTGTTAEKHDAFLTIDRQGNPIEELSGSQLMQGEPDASSFPNGGSRATFEARGYTAWDLTSPMFLLRGTNGLTLCIPTAFISYTGQALDIKTPLLRSITKLSEVATTFCNLIGEKDVKHVRSTCGAEQEYFLVDKAFFYARPDLVMTGRTMIGKLSAKNQQLDDHYFGDISDRVMAFMQEFDLELYRLGIPSKTRHNEVAPGQFEMAPIFSDANIASDNNQVIMATLRKVAGKHNFVAMLHEKPFAGINGSGKHLNWSLGTDTGLNLLEPGANPQSNLRFLTMVSIVVEATKRHAKMIRASIASAGNDHRLGANEAPPSIISVFLGDTIDRIMTSILEGKTFTPNSQTTIDMGASQLTHLAKDNTDRNRTSPFAFTGNKFELRACGSDMAIGWPLSVLNAAISDVFTDSNEYIKNELDAGKKIEDILLGLIKKWMGNSKDVVFNGDGYSDDWVKEAASRGLPNLKTTPDSLPVLIDENETSFLTKQEIFSKDELDLRYNVLTERYITLREIEFETQVQMVHQHVLPAIFKFKKELGGIITNQNANGLECSVETELYKKVNFASESLFASLENMKNALSALTHDEQKRAEIIAREIMPLSEEVANLCGDLEDILPDNMWELPKYYDMLFLK